VPALVFRNGPLAGYRYEVSQEMSIGRENAAITLQDDEVSRRHAVIRPVQEGLEVQDLGSTNGTWVNDRRVEGPTVIRPSDVLRLGRLSFDVQLDTVVAPAPQPAAAGQPYGPAASQAPPQASFQPPGHRAGRRGPATRSIVPVFVTFGVIIGTAILLVLYFGLRGSV
jgi:predicted component of type VI protein secretion system